MNERDTPPPLTDAELRKVRDVPLEAVLLLGPQTARIAAELLAARARIAELEAEVAQLGRDAVACWRAWASDVGGGDPPAGWNGAAMARVHSYAELFSKLDESGRRAR